MTRITISRLHVIAPPWIANAVRQYITGVYQKSVLEEIPCNVTRQGAHGHQGKHSKYFEILGLGLRRLICDKSRQQELGVW